MSTSVGERAAALGGEGPPDWSPVPERPQSRAAKIGGIVFRAVAALLVAAFLWSRGHHLAALLLVCVGATVAAASARFPSVSRRVARVERAVEHGAGRVLSVVLIGGVQLLVFTPLSLLLRLLGYNPLALGQSPADPSFWRPALKRPGRPLYRRPFAYDRLPPGQRTRTSRALRIRAALGLIAILALLDIGIGTAIDKLQDDSAPVLNTDLRAGATPPAGHGQPWRRLLPEVTTAFGRRQYDPYLGWRVLESRGRYVNVRHGVRRSYVPAGGGAGEPIKVFFMGGSALFGAFQRDEHTIPSEFARLAEADGIPVRVVNYGQPAYVNWQEVLLLEQLASGPSRPDLVVFYDGYNEVMLQFSLGRHRRPAQLEAPVIEERLRLGEPESEPSPWTELYNAWTDASAVHRLGRGLGVFAERDEQGEPLRPFWHGDQAEQPVRRGAAAAAVYERGVRLAQGMSRRLGFRSAFFWQPSIYTKQVVKGEEGLDAERSADPAAWRKVTRAARARLEPPVVDLGDVLDKHRAPLMYDIVHTNETGARIVAKALYGQLRPQLREELSRR